MSKARSQKSTQGKSMKNKKQKGEQMRDMKPNKIYESESFQKTDYTKSLEDVITSVSTTNFSYEKLVNTTLQTLFKLNPLNKIEEVDNLVKTISKITHLNELKTTLRLINLKLKKFISPSGCDIPHTQNSFDISTKSVDRETLSEVLFCHKDLSEKKFFKIFYSLSLLTHTKDSQTIKRVNTLLKNENTPNPLVIDYVTKNHKFFSFNNPYITNLYPYGGGKQKFYEPINNHFKEVVDTKTISHVIDPFMGGLGTFYSLFNLIKEKKPSVILNDLNPSIYQLNKDVQSKKGHKLMMFHISKIIQNMFIKYNTCHVTVEEYKEFHKSLLQRLNEIETNRTPKNSIEGSSILLFIINNGFGGNYEMKDNKSSISPSTDLKKVNRFFNFVGKIELYHYLYNTVNVKFHNQDYKTILKNHSGNNDTFTTMDPPYFKTNTMSIQDFDSQIKQLNELLETTPKTNTKEYESLKRQKYELIRGCTYNYGDFGNDFPHEELLKDLKLIKGELSYFNYKHPMIEKYSKEYGLTIQYLERKSTNGKNIKGVQRVVKEETFMTGRIQPINSSQTINNVVVNNVNFMNPHSMIQKVS